jgi:hypothetical protein
MYLRDSAAISAILKTPVIDMAVVLLATAE